MAEKEHSDRSFEAELTRIRFVQTDSRFKSDVPNNTRGSARINVNFTFDGDGEYTPLSDDHFVIVGTLTLEAGLEETESDEFPEVYQISCTAVGDFKLTYGNQDALTEWSDYAHRNDDIPESDYPETKLGVNMYPYLRNVVETRVDEFGFATPGLPLTMNDINLIAPDIFGQD